MQTFHVVNEIPHHKWTADLNLISVDLATVCIFYHLCVSRSQKQLLLFDLGIVLLQILLLQNLERQHNIQI